MRFKAKDMKKSVVTILAALSLLFLLTSCGDGQKFEVRLPSGGSSSAAQSEPSEGSASSGVGEETAPGGGSQNEEDDTMKIKVTDGTHTVLFELNASSPAKSLYDQLPLTVEVENYSDNEKIFYPEKLDTSDPVDADAKKGTLAYFSPWGDVVMYYGDFGSYTGLYELGKAVSGEDEIENLAGTLQITKE